MSMKLYFPTTDFLGRVEISQNGKLEKRYDKDQLFFNVLNNPGYINQRLCSNFNNKLNRFFDAYPYLKNFTKDKKVSFYEYSTLSHKLPQSHQEIAQGSLSWTLAYYIASLTAVFDTVGNHKKKWAHVVLTGDIGNFSDWNHLSDVDEILQKLKVTVLEFLFHPQLKSVNKALWISKSSHPINIETFRQMLPDVKFEVASIGPGKKCLYFKERDFSLTLIEAESTASVLDELLGSSWPKKREASRKLVRYAVFLFILLTIGLLLKWLVLNQNKPGEIPVVSKDSSLYKIYPMFNIKMVSSLKDNLAPYGFLNMSVIISDQNSHSLSESSRISKIEIMGPDNQLFRALAPHARFNMVTESYFSGYITVFQENSLMMWVGADLSYHIKRFPPYGIYTFLVTDTSGAVHKTSILFQERNRKDPIEGFPEKIQYDQVTRKVSWTPTRGQFGYAVSVFHGVKKGQEDWQQMVYRSMFYYHVIREPYFILPKEVQLKRGESYYILVEAFDSPEGNLAPYFYNFVHVQNDSSQIASFTVK